MTRFVVTAPARADIEQLLATSLERWGEAGKARYEALVTAGLRRVVREPDGLTSRPRPELAHDLRSLHLRHVRGRHGVKAPVHVVYYRYRSKLGIVEVARVLHERIEPSDQLTNPVGPSRR